MVVIFKRDCQVNGGPVDDSDENLLPEIPYIHHHRFWYHLPIMTVHHCVYRHSIMSVKRYVIEEDRFTEVFKDPCYHCPRPQTERYVLQVDCHSDSSWPWSFRLPFKLLNSDSIGGASLLTLRNDVPPVVYVLRLYIFA
jgi:hypothetical protein